MHSDFDVCSVLAIIEFAINCLAQCAMILAVHSIASDKHLHGNFKWVIIGRPEGSMDIIRFVLCLALSRTLLNFIRRIFANYWTLFWTDAIKEDFLVSLSVLANWKSRHFQVLYKCISIFTSMLLSISMQLVAMERLLYTYNIANYEKTHATACSLAFCAAFLVSPVAGWIESMRAISKQPSWLKVRMIVEHSTSLNPWLNDQSSSDPFLIGHNFVR